MRPEDCDCGLCQPLATMLRNQGFELQRLRIESIEQASRLAAWRKEADGQRARADHYEAEAARKHRADPWARAWKWAAKLARRSARTRTNPGGWVVVS